jgi:FixJ family two-component response regulator
MSCDRPLVFVVDDDISVRESLELLVRHAGWQPETFESAQEFLSLPRVFVPSCLILDINLPGLNGLDLQKRVATDRTDMPIIFITGYGDVPTTVQAMKAGAVEFLTKPFGDDALLSAIQNALELSRTALEREAEMQGLRERYDSLSRREREVMALVVRGLLNKQVGFELGISEITVKAHRGNVMRKMNAGSLPDLVNIAAKLCLSDPKQWPSAFMHSANKDAHSMTEPTISSPILASISAMPGMTTAAAKLSEPHFGQSSRIAWLLALQSMLYRYRSRV